MFARKRLATIGLIAVLSVLVTPLLRRRLGALSHGQGRRVVLAQALDTAALLALKQQLEQRLQPFGFAHTTIELELPGEACRDRRSD